MPLSDHTLAKISQWFMTHSPISQMIHERSQDFAIQNRKNCQHWATRGLIDNRVDIQNTLITISEGKSLAPLQLVSDKIHKLFGTIWQPVVAGGNGLANRIARNQLRPQLHELTATVFEYCLRENGFTLTQQSDYMVCMEYECSGEGFMYPNFTHAWLAYRDSFVVQKVTDSYISISMREAGRPLHSGIIRRPVIDFLPEQIKVIEDIVNHPAQGLYNVTNCFPQIALDKDVFSPRE